jgi:hypothetical protein
MDGLKRLLFNSPSRDDVRKAFTETERWETLGGQTAQLHRYTGITEDLLTIYPRNFEEDKAMHKSITEIFKDQAFKTCTQIEIFAEGQTECRSNI